MDKRPGRRPAKWDRGLVAAVSLAAHFLILLAMFPAQAYPPPPFDPEPMIVALVEPPPMAETIAPPSPAPPAPAPPAPAKPSPARIIARKPLSPPPAEVEPLPAGETETEADEANVAGISLGDGELAGARTAGSGSGGGACDMVRWLQNELRKDAQVRAAVTNAHRTMGSTGKAVLVWNGDWIRSRGEEGNGLAVVREAMIMEIAFAPAACRAEAMRGLVLISLSDDPRAAGLAFGSGQWRWSDMLFAQGTVSGGRAMRP